MSVETGPSSANTYLSAYHKGDVRDILVNILSFVARVLFFWLPTKEAQGHALMYLHSVAGLGLIATFFLLPPKSPWKLAIAGGALSVLVGQFVFRGCILSRAEQQLTGTKDTIIDPLLQLCGIELTGANRKSATIISTVAICLIMIWATTVDYIKPSQMHAS